MPTEKEVQLLLERTKSLLSVRGYSRRTGDAYVRWVGRFLRARPSIPAEGLKRVHVEAFLTELTHKRALAPKSRNQAASALAFFFREILERDELASMPRAREPRRIPTILSHRQVQIVLGHLGGKYRLLGSLMYGTGLRLTEAHQLRIKDVDFDLLQIAVRDGTSRRQPGCPASQNP